MATRMQQRRGTASEWTTADPTLAAGEIGYETDTNQFKIGDGSTAWSSLTYFKTYEGLDGSGMATEAEVTAAVNQAILDMRTERGTEIAAAVADEATDRNTAIADAITVEGARSDAYADQAELDATTTAASYTNTAITTHSTDTTDVHGIADTSVLATDSDVAAAQSNAQSYADGLVGDPAIDGSTGNTVVDRIATDVSTHNSTTQNVHGIADTSLLATSSDVSTAVSTHNADTTNVHGIADTSVLATDSDVSSAVSAHAAVTTNVHGIADTSVLATDSDVTAAQTAAEGHADGVVAAHNNATTSVHGIADTSDLALLSGADQTFSGNITVSGNFTVSGTTTTVSTQDLVVNDPMIYIGEGSTGNTADLGIVGSFNDGTYQHAGIVRDASDNIWKLFKGVTDEPGTTINFAQGSLDDLAVNNVEVAGVVFTDGTQTKVGVPSITPIAEKTASYTLSSTTERDTIIEVNSASATTLTIPADDGLNFPVGTTLDVIQTGAGQVTIAGATGVTVNATPGLKLRAQWSSVTLLKRGANSWLVFGDTSA